MKQAIKLYELNYSKYGFKIMRFSEIAQLFDLFKNKKMQNFCIYQIIYKIPLIFNKNKICKILKIYKIHPQTTYNSS